MALVWAFSLCRFNCQKSVQNFKQENKSEKDNKPKIKVEMK